MQRPTSKGRKLRDCKAAEHAPNTVEWLDDLSDVSHYLGYLEFLNQNHAGAAVESRTAADAAGRWAKLEPQRLEPRARQAYSLLNAGNALVNIERYGEVEPLYLEATRLIDAVVAVSVTDKNHLYQAAESYGKLGNLYRLTNNLAGWEKAAGAELDRIGRLTRECRDSPESLRRAAQARHNLANALARQRKWDEADCHFAVLVATRERVRDAAPGNLVFADEYIDAVLAQADFFTARGQPDRAGDLLQLAVGALEKAQSAAPNADGAALELASASTRYADFLRNNRQFKDAENRYEQALTLTAAVIRRSPNPRPAREMAARAATGRAHLYNASGRHREAATEWAKLAVEDPDPEARTSHALFVQQSLLYAGDWRASVAAASARMTKDQPAWMWLETAHALCCATKLIQQDDELTPAEQTRELEKTVGLAVACLEKSKAKGEFATPERIRWFAENSEFAPVRGKFDPAKK